MKGLKLAWILAVATLLPQASASGQGAVPAGTLIPVTMSGGLRSDRAHAGQPIRAKVMQDVPGSPVRRGNEVLGRVVQVQTTANRRAELRLSFDAVRIHRQTIPLKTSLRALASFVAVGQAQVPEEGASRGITPEVATTEQIGGEQVYRAGGTVNRGDEVVGRPTAYGVLGLPRASIGQPCRGVVDANTRPQAFWLFSTDACGVYGLSDLRIEQAGRTDPKGEIVLASDAGKVELKSGTALLLRAQSQ